ncbi:MAG: RNA pseudouridine synthase [Crocinitomicaceae bacterium]|nr:RNA pseudouridine synthase [Crocinitomicaceae bacterium]MBK8925626.1 RNA pseudouridine synthase [Crocinitomicaceae bacterium]
MSLEILYEDNHIIAVNKKGGDIVQGDKTGDRTLGDDVKAYIKEKYKKPGDVFLGTVHRIDRPTTGIVLFARTSKALERLNKMFQTKEIQKTYWAVTENPPPTQQGTLIHYLTRNEKQNKSYPHATEIKDSKKAELNYYYEGKSNHYFFIRIEPITGRHHQIRVQLSAIGCVIKGDLKYGARRSNPDGSIHLHAQKVVFIHPVSKEEIVINAPAPNEPNWNEFNRVMHQKNLN